MRILALLPLLGMMEFLPAASLERSGQFNTIALVSVLRMLLNTLVTVSLAFAGFSYMSLAYGNVEAL